MVSGAPAHEGTVGRGIDDYLAGISRRTSIQLSRGTSSGEPFPRTISPSSLNVQRCLYNQIVTTRSRTSLSVMPSGRPPSGEQGSRVRQPSGARPVAPVIWYTHPDAN